MHPTSTVMFALLAEQPMLWYRLIALIMSQVHVVHKYLLFDCVLNLHCNLLLMFNQLFQGFTNLA